MHFRPAQVLHLTAVIALTVVLVAAIPRVTAALSAPGGTAFAGVPQEGCRQAVFSPFNPVLTLNGVLPTGSLGLPGEPITWVITVSNQGSAAGTNLVIGDTLRDELRIDSVEVSRGEYAVNQQTVMFTLPDLQPGEMVEMRIYTTVRRGLSNGVMINQALLEAVGPGGKVSRSAVAEVFVPTGLPPTGYPPEDLPGEGEPSFEQIGLIALAAVTLTALYVWHRGRRA